MRYSRPFMDSHSIPWRFGFTLIEVMVVLAIVAILAVVAAPALSAWVGVMQLRTTTNELASSLQYARSEAIKRGWPVSVCPSTQAQAAQPACAPGAAQGTAPWAQGWLVFVDHAQDGQLAWQPAGGQPADLLLRAHAPTMAGLSVSVGSNFAPYLSYLANGVSQGAGALSTGSFGLCLQGQAQGRAVVVNATGRVSVTALPCSP